MESAEEKKAVAPAVAKTWWERWRDVVFVGMFIAIIVILLMLFDANYRTNVVLQYLWNGTCPKTMTFGD